MASLAHQHQILELYSVLGDLSEYIKNTYHKYIKILIVNDEVSSSVPAIQLHSRYIKYVADGVEVDDKVVVLHDHGYTYVNYPFLDIEVVICDNPENGKSRSPCALIGNSVSEAEVDETIFSTTVFSSIRCKEDTTSPDTLPEENIGKLITSSTTRAERVNSVLKRAAAESFDKEGLDTPEIVERSYDEDD